MGRNNGASAHVALGDWLKLYCLGFLNLIPILGFIAYIVIVCMIGFGNKSARSMKTSIQASLIIGAIILAIYIILLIAFLPVIMSMRTTIQ